MGCWFGVGGAPGAGVSRRAAGKLGLEAAGGVEVDALVGLSVANFQRVPGSCLPVPVDLPAQAGYGLPGSPGAGVRVPAGDVPYIGYIILFIFRFFISFKTAFNAVMLP